MELRKLGGILLLGALAFGIIGWASSRSHKPVATQVVEATPTDKWHVTKGKSPMDDSKTVVLSLDSDNEVQGPLEAVRPALIVRCQEKKTQVYVVTGMAATVETDIDGGPRDSHKVGLRLDDRPATYDSWGESTDHKALFAGDLIWGEQWDSLIGMNAPKVVAYSGGVVELAKKLTGASTLTFQFTPFDGSPQTARFDLRGLDAHLHDVAEACGWAY
jgi:type VI secretion system protein VasI